MEAEVRVLQRPQAQDCWWTLEAGRGKEQINPKSPHREHSSTEVSTPSL